VNNQSGIFLLFMLLATLTVLLITGCQTIPQTYSAADQATYEAIAPEYTAYVKRDDKLSTPQKELRLNTLRTWQERIDAQEENSGNP
jgi:hypothetical protein